MRRRLWLICLMVFVCMLSSTVVWVEEKKVDYSEAIEFFTWVFSYAEVNKDPLIMVSAVRMLDALPFDSITIEGSDVPFNRNTLLDLAREYASGDKEVLAVIDKVEEEKITLRGPRHPPVVHHPPPVVHRPPVVHHPPPGGHHPPPGGHHPPPGGHHPPPVVIHPPTPTPVVTYESSPVVDSPPGGHARLCFIATAAYGSSTREEVSTLQEFRDRYLLTHPPGKILVKVYYALSPPLAGFIARHESLKALTCGFLYPVVEISRYLLKDPAGFALFWIRLLLLGMILAGVWIINPVDRCPLR